MAKGRFSNKSKGAGLGWSGRFLALFVLLGSLTVMPTTILFMIAMVPTFVAFFVDKDKRKMSGYSIGVLNFAATVAFIVRLWVEGHTMANLTQILINPTTLMIIYASAWLGWLLYFFIPPFIAEVVKKSAQKRISKIQKQQLKIIEEWGEAVTGEIQMKKLLKTREEIDMEQESA